MEVLSLEHQCDTTHHFAFTIACYSSITHGRTISHFCYITHKHRNAIDSLYGNLPNIIQRARQSDTTDKIQIVALFYITTTRILIITFYGFIKIDHRETERGKTVGINGYFVLLYMAAPSVHLGHTFGTCKLLSYNPVLYGADV